MFYLFFRKVRLFDCKSDNAKTWLASGEVEKVVWNHYNHYTCFVSKKFQINNNYVFMI